MTTNIQVARIDYTVDTNRGRGSITTRKSVEVRASEAKLPAAVERKLAKLADVGAYNTEVRYELQTS